MYWNCQSEWRYQNRHAPFAVRLIAVFLNYKTSGHLIKATCEVIICVLRRKGPKKGFFLWNKIKLNDEARTGSSASSERHVAVPAILRQLTAARGAVFLHTWRCVFGSTEFSRVPPLALHSKPKFVCHLVASSETTGGRKPKKHDKKQAEKGMWKR